MLTRPLFFVFLIFMLSSYPLHAQQEVLLWPDGAPGALDTTANDRPSMFVYRAPEAAATGAAVLICPGGGYQHLAMDHEGHAVAQWFNRMGITAFVLKYRLGAHGYRHPAMLHDAQRAMRLIRYGAEQYDIHPEKIGVMGFSAGGHLASTLGTHYDDGLPQAANTLDATSSRPNYMVLIYPVIQLNSRFTHRGSRQQLLGSNPSQALVDSLSNHTQVTSMTPPTFLVHSSDDRVVPPQNSLQFYLQLHEHHVPAELHLFEYGGHGYGMAPDDATLNRWTTLCQEWLARMQLARVAQE